MILCSNGVESFLHVDIVSVVRLIGVKRSRMAGGRRRPSSSETNRIEALPVDSIRLFFCFLCLFRRRMMRIASFLAGRRTDGARIPPRAAFIQGSLV